MALSWNEIKDRALNFSKEWAETSNEEADAKPFLVEFLMFLALAVKGSELLSIELKTGRKRWLH